MEEQPETSGQVQIAKAVFDGLEAVRRSGATNMLDRPMVLSLAKEWGFAETAEWIESVDTGTYGRLIIRGPQVLENEPTDKDVEQDAIDPGNELELLRQVLGHERARMQDIVDALGKRAILTIADTYETERMGVLSDPSRLGQINAERNALVRNIGKASALRLRLDETMSEVERGIGSLRFLIDPENN